MKNKSKFPLSSFIPLFSGEKINLMHFIFKMMQLK